MITIKPRPPQQECLDLINANPTGRYIIAAHVGYGKRQPYSSLILTPSGYVKMGDLKIGDVIYDGYGEETNVIGIYEQGIQDVYKVTFSDDSVCECGLEHLWKVKTHRSKNWKVITLEEIMDKGLYLLNGSKGIQLEGKEGKYAYRYEIPLASINHKPKDFDIHPYLMGVLLGDGCFTEKQQTCQISCPDSAYDIIENVEKVLPQGYYLRENRYNSCPHYVISSGKINKSFLHYIDDLGLRKYSKDKFIPNAYFQGSREQRKELLSGLLDTDGSVGVRNQITFHTTSKQLALDVIKLIQSLGGIGKLRIYDRADVNKSIEYQVNVSVNFNPFKTSIKASKVTERVKFTPKRKFKSIEKVRQEQSRCIMVDSPDHTYITNDYIVTHNTFIMSRIKKLGRVLILSHREELVYQPLKYMSGTTGVEKGKEKSNHTEDVVSASVQTLSRRLDEYDPEEFYDIYYDEAHHAAAPENRKILEYFKPKRLIGFSATPSRNDGTRLDDIFDKVLYEYDIKQGIDNGYLAPIKVLSVKMDYDLANVKMRMGDLAPTGLAEAMKDTAPSIAEAYYKYARGSTLIFCASVELAYKVAELIKGAEVIEGKTSPDKRREILEKFLSGEIKVVCNNLVLTEGYDNPRIETIIMARPTTNTNLSIQMIGRSCRLFEGKESALVIDCVSATRDGLASPTSLLGYDMPLAALKRMKEEEVDLFDIPDLAEELADVPETWIKGVKEVDIWAKKHKVKLHDMNLRKRGDGSLVIGLPNNIFYEVPPIDVLGKIEIQGQKVKAQEVIDSLFTRLMTHHRPEMPIWSKRSSKRWGSKPLTQKQYDMIRHLKNVDLSDVEITKLTSMEASIIIGESKLRRKK